MSRATRRSLLTLLAVIAAVFTPTRRAGAQSPAVQPAVEEFTVFIYEAPAALARRNDAREADGYWQAYNTFAMQLAQAGALRGGSALSETTAVTVRGNGGADGAVRGARLGGYFVIAAANLDAAKELARLAPEFAVAVEVRPHRPNPTMAATPKP